MTQSVSTTPNQPQLLRARHFGKTLFKPALSLAGYPLLLGVLALVIAAILMIENDFFRILLNGVLVALIGLLVVSSGAGRGAKDAAYSIRLRQDIENGYQATEEDYAKAFHPLKGIGTALLGALPWLILAVLVALLAKPYTYLLQDMPESYLGYYLRRWDLGAPVAFYYQVQNTMEPVTILRIFLRIGIVPFVNMAGTVTDAVSLFIDHISPLLVLFLPLLYAVSYQFGPMVQAKEERRMEAAILQHQKKVRRKQRKERALREKKKPEQLI